MYEWKKNRLATDPSLDYSVPKGTLCIQYCMTNSGPKSISLSEKLNIIECFEAQKIKKLDFEEKVIEIGE